MAKPCFITFDSKEYSYDEWVAFLYEGGLNSFVENGNIKLPESKVKKVGREAVKAESVEQEKPKAGERNRFALSISLAEDIQAIGEYVYEAINDNPQLSKDDLKAFAFNEIGDNYSENEFNDVFDEGYKEGVNMAATGIVEPMTKKLNEAFLGIGSEFLDGSDALKKKAEEVMKGMGGVRYNITMPNGEKKEVMEVSPEVVDGFYSPIEKKILDTKQNNLSATKWKELFGKGDEAKYTGVLDFLNTKKPEEQVKKKEILDYMKDNRIKIVEVVKGENLKPKILIRFDEIIDTLRQRGYDIEVDDYGTSDMNVRSFDNGDLILEEGARISDMKSLQEDGYRFLPTYEEDVDLFNEAKKISRKISYEQQKEDTLKDTRFSQYQLEGEKSNYKEVLVTMPSKNPLQQKVLELEKIYEKDGSNYNLRELENAKEELKKSQTTSFRSSHFDEPNILVHLRMNTRTDADGNKVLFLEEVQSDWGQKGKKEGFKKEVKPSDIEILSDEPTYYDDEKRSMRNEVRMKIKGFPEVDNGAYFPAKETLEQAKERWAKSYSEVMGTPTAPFVTDTNAWTKLGLKFALQEAVRQGADKIAWTTGEQQNERYDLSKQVDEIIYSKNSDGTYDLYAVKNGETVSQNFNKKDNELEGIVGKDVTNRIINNEGESVPSTKNKSLTGENLKVGGKGMIGFYGSVEQKKEGIVGGVAKALVKELTGNKVEIGETKILNINKPDIWEDNKGNWNVTYVDDNGYENTHTFSYEKSAKSYAKQLEEDQKITQPSIDITPEIINKVNMGLPMFHLNDKGEILGFSVGNKIYLNSEKLTPKTTMEEAGHIWINWAKTNRPDLHAEGLKKVDKSKYLSEVENSNEYKAAAKESGLKEGTQEWKDYMKEEALAKAIADEGAKFVSESRKSDFKEWLNQLWDDIAKFFGIRDMNIEDIKKMTLQDFARSVAADVFSPKAETQMQTGMTEAETGETETKGGEMKTRGHYDSITEAYGSMITALENKKEMAEFLKKINDEENKDKYKYRVVTNKESLQNAINYIKENDIDKSLEYASSLNIDPIYPSRQPIVGFLLYDLITKEAMAAAKMGNKQLSLDLMEKVQNLFEKQVERATIGGQHSQGYYLIYADIYSDPAKADFYYRTTYERNNRKARQNPNNIARAKNVGNRVDKAKEKAKKDTDAAVNEMSSSTSKNRRFTLNAKQKQEKDDALKSVRSKFGSIFFDITTFPALITDKDFRKYLRLTLKESAYDAANFTEKIVTDLGEKARRYKNEFIKAAQEAESEYKLRNILKSIERRIDNSNISEEEKNENKLKREAAKANKEMRDNMLKTLDFNKDENVIAYAKTYGFNTITVEDVDNLKPKLIELQNVLKGEETQKTLEDKFKDILKDRDITIKKLANMRIDGEIKTLEILKQELIDKAQLSDTEAAEYAERIESIYRKMRSDYFVSALETDRRKANKIRMYQIAKEGKFSTLNDYKAALMKEGGMTAKEIEKADKKIKEIYETKIKGEALPEFEEATQVEKLIKEYQDGKLNEQSIMDILASRFGIANYTPAMSQIVLTQVAKLQQTNNPIARQNIINNMISQLVEKSPVNYRDLYESLWYANTLSGLSTIDTNLAAGIYANVNEFYKLASEHLISAATKSVSGNKEQAIREVKNLINSLQFGLTGQLQEEGTLQDRLAEILANRINPYRYTIVHGNDIVQEELKQLTYGKEGEVDWTKLSKNLDFMNKYTKIVARNLNGIDITFANPVKDAITINMLYDHYYNKFDKDVVVSRAIGGYEVTDSGTSVGIYSTEKEANKKREEILSDKINNEIDSVMYQTNETMMAAVKLAIDDRKLSDLTTIKEGNKFVVKDNDKVVGRVDTQTEADDLINELAPTGLRFWQYVQEHRRSIIPKEVLESARDYAANQLGSGKVKGTLGYVYEKGVVRLKKRIAREQKELREKSAVNLENKQVAHIFANGFLYALLEDIDKTFVFMRTGFNMVNNFTNWTPLAYIRAARGGAIINKTNIDTFNEAQKNRLIAQASVGVLIGAAKLLQVLSDLDDDDEDKKKKKKIAEDYNKKHPDSPINSDSPIFSIPKEGDVIGSMAGLPKDLKDFLVQNKLAAEYSEFDGKNWNSYLSDPKKVLSYAAIGTYYVHKKYIENNPLLQTDKDKKKYDSMSMAMNVTASTLRILLSSSNMKGIKRLVDLASFLEGGNQGQNAKNQALNFLLSPTNLLQPNLIKTALTYFDHYETLPPDDISSYMYSKMPLYINMIASKPNYAYNMFGHKIVFVPAQQQGIVAPVMKAVFSDTKEQKNDMEMSEYLLSKGYQDPFQINFNAGYFSFIDEKGNVDYISNHPDYVESISKNTGEYFYKFLKASKDSERGISNLSTEVVSPYSQKDGYKYPKENPTTPFNEAVRKKWRFAIDYASMDFYMKNNFYINKDGRLAKRAVKVAE